MKKLLAIIVLSLYLITPSQADDLRDFQIDGMSVGESVLDYFSEDEIKIQLSRTSSNYKSKRIKRVYFMSKKNSIYEQVTFHYINNPSYIIVAVQGHNKYENNIDACYKKKIDITKEIENIYPPLSKKERTNNHRGDKFGKSKVEDVILEYVNGHIKIACTSWGKEIKKIRPWRDTLKVIVATNEYIDWINNEAYK